jgi:hypothetical protein
MDIYVGNYFKMIKHTLLSIGVMQYAMWTSTQHMTAKVNDLSHTIYTVLGDFLNIFNIRKNGKGIQSTFNFNIKPIQTLQLQ